MSLIARFKKWALVGTHQPVNQLREARAHIQTSILEQEKLCTSMVGEPVTSFIASLQREPKRYKLEKVLKLSSVEFPAFTCYNWMHGAGHYTLLDKKTGTKYAAYVHERGCVYDVYGLPFKLNHWELSALFGAFNEYRAASRRRLYEIRDWANRRARAQREAQEIVDRQRFAEQFK